MEEKKYPPVPPGVRTFEELERLELEREKKLEEELEEQIVTWTGMGIFGGGNTGSMSSYVSGSL